MKLDNARFIARHHKTAQENILAAPRKENLYMRFIPISAVVVYVGFFALLAVLGYMYDLSGDVIGITCATGAFFGFLVLCVYIFYKKQNYEYQLMHEVLEGSRGARLVTGPHDRTVFYNGRFEELCEEVGPPDYQSLTALFAANDESLAHFRLLADQAHRGLTDSIELLSTTPKYERWLMVTAQPLAERKGHIHWRIDDVTEKHTVDSAMREEREKLIDFTDNAPVGFFSVNEEGRFVFANATFARWVGEDLKNLLNNRVLHTFLETPPEKAKPYDLTEEGGARQVVEVQMKGPAGRTFLASVNQVLVHDEDGGVRSRAVVHDLTAEREMRRALKASEDRFQRFFEEAPLGIIMLNAQGGIDDSNTAFADMLGLRIEDVEGRPLDGLIHEDARASALEAIGKIEQGQQMAAPLEITLKTKDGRIETQMHGRRFREGGGIVLHFIDLSKQKALEEQFVQSQKMQAVGQLAGGIAHDFNNLLTAMVGFCDLLLLRHKPGDPSFSDIMQIKQNSNRAANLVRQLLAFSRQQTLRPKVHDVTDILTELSHLMRRLIGANIELDLVHGHDLGLVKVDEGQMEQVLINLAVNARDAMDGGGKLTIETENFTNKKPRKLGTEEMPPGHWVLIKVTDTGSGIPKEIMDRIFEPFFTTKKVGQGTGLGLSTVYGIIRQTGGYLHVESKLKHGTTFFIYLPRVNEGDMAGEEKGGSSEAEETGDLTGTERLLLVEDEDAVRTFSTRALANKGYDVLSADCGENALDVFAKLEGKPLDLLITDVVMPGMDGPTLAQKIRESAPDIKIIFMSGYTEDKLKDHMGENIFFLPKPFTLKQLAAKVKEVLEG